MLVSFGIIGSILVYIQNCSIHGKSLPKTLRQFAKDLYHEETPLSIEDETFRSKNFCEVIHIGVVCSGSSSNLQFHTLLKSIFSKRLNPIHFHLLVSNESKTVLRLLFETWQIPLVNVSFYNINPWLTHVRWVPNKHYSGNYGLLKLLFNKVVPLNITKKLLVLDTDLIINDDLYSLWKLFEEFNEKQVLGIGENQSPYYSMHFQQGRAQDVVKNGFNSGVMLYDLEGLNIINWDELWVNATKRYYTAYGPARLGDQDIINSVIAEHSDIVFELPCYWNIQISGHSTSSKCYQRFKPKIIHWNSPQKYAAETKDSEMFRGLAESIFESNGNWFRNYPQLCGGKTLVHSEDKSTSNCQKFVKPPNIRYRTLLFLVDFIFIADNSDITYVTHLSFDRLYCMEKIVQMWTGPITFTLYVSDMELDQTLEFIRNSELLSGRSNIAYHAVFKEGDFYPVNTLRNIGLTHVNTPYVFLVDVDFIPMKSLFEILKDSINSIGELKKKALIVPAFELSNSSVELPKTKTELVQSLDKNEVRQFLGLVWAAGHAPTDYKRWRTEYQPYHVKWKPHYEPYTIVAKDVIQYDERFSGFGWNKVSHIMELEAQNYEFIVLSDVFIIHQPHSKSYDNMQYKRSPIYRKCIQSLKRRFVQDLYKKYNRPFPAVSYPQNLQIAFFRCIQSLKRRFVQDLYKKYNRPFPAVSYPQNLQRTRQKRDINLDATTTLYESTDYFLTWGGREKAMRKKEAKKKFTRMKVDDNFSHEAFVEYDYYYYDADPPYNLTIFKLKPNETEPKTHLVNTKQVNLSSSEEHDYEYDQDDIKFKNVHDSTTLPYSEENSGLITDSNLLPHVRNVTVDGKQKHIEENSQEVSVA